LSTMNFLLALPLALFLLLASPARAEVFIQPALIQLGAAYHYSNSLPDNVAGATYEKKFVNGFVGNLRVGSVLSPGVYIGGVAGQWQASRKLTLSGVEQSDSLSYRTLGLEVGAFLENNPRVFFMLVGGAHYPLTAEITSTTAGVAQTFTNADTRWALELRAVVGIKLASRFSLMLDCGYQWANLRYFNSGTTPYIAGGDQFNLSGAKFGANLGFHI